MKLYAFGHNSYSELVAPTPSSTSNPLSPVCILEAAAIQVLWTSWCDIVIAYQSPADTWTIQYRGTGLPPKLQEHIAQSVPIREAVNGHRRTLHFFGSTLHDGLRGYFITSTDGTNSGMCIFSTDLEVEGGMPLVRKYSSALVQKTSTVQMDSAGRVLLGLRMDENENDNENQTRNLHFNDLNELVAHLAAQSESSPSTQQLAPFIPTQWCTNATTSTALSSDGQVFTSSRDLRFPKCLGRTPTNPGHFESIPYFSETCIQAISSGGYMSGAVSTDGELFLWGQSIPGHDGSIAVLEESALGDDDLGGRGGTRISCAPEQDELIKCLDVYIDGMEARTCRLAIGHGHVLIAAEVRGIDGNTKRAVLGAGVNSNGQLGLQTTTTFVKHFEEISVFRDVAIQQLVATGWSTFVVTL